MGATHWDSNFGVSVWEGKSLAKQSKYLNFSHANEVREAIHAFHISSERSFG